MKAFTSLSMSVPPNSFAPESNQNHHRHGGDHLERGPEDSAHGLRRQLDKLSRQVDAVEHQSNAAEHQHDSGQPVWTPHDLSLSLWVNNSILLLRTAS